MTRERKEKTKDFMRILNHKLDAPEELSGYEISFVLRRI